jgi:hypothetical protein
LHGTYGLHSFLTSKRHRFIKLWSAFGEERMAVEWYFARTGAGEARKAKGFLNRFADERFLPSVNMRVLRWKKPVELLVTSTYIPIRGFSIGSLCTTMCATHRSLGMWCLTGLRRLGPQALLTQAALVYLLGTREAICTAFIALISITLRHDNCRSKRSFMQICF